MEEKQLYHELAMHIGAPPSERIPRLWEMLCDSDEARLCLAMPGTVNELAGKMGKPAREIEKMIQVLFRKGVVFEKVKGDVTQYSMSKNIIQFHDATIVWPEAPQEFLDLWQAFMDAEYPALAKIIAGMDLEPMTRVVPVQQALEGGGSRVLPFESAVKILEDSRRIAVTKCTCRFTAKKCNAPIEVCIQLNRAAEYTIKRGSGREISLEEGKKILKECEDKGLVHLTDNRATNEHILCNCCSCCCITLPVIAQMGSRVLLAPSRYMPAVDEGKCTFCGVCVECCPVKAISMKHDDGAQQLAVKEDLCIGCGQCAYHCPEEAIVLMEVRSPDFIPGVAAS
jgi:Pyruvate/2-oxoacid:ferredoxin oxidoreductase delta subunit